MRRLFLSLGFLAAALVSSSVFAATDLPSAFPDHFGSWTAASPATRDKLGVEPQFRQLFAESGEVDFLYRQYSSGSHSLTLSISSFRDPSGAYEAFTYFRSREMANATLTETSALQNDRALFLVGNFLVRVNALTPGMAEADLKDLAGRLRPYADVTPFPPVRTYLPRESLVSGSDVYALGPAAFRSAISSLNQPEFASLDQEAGFTSGAEAVVARYHTAAGDAVLLLIEYPTPQLAEQQLHHLQLALARTSTSTGVAVERKASLLSIVLGSPSPAYAKSLRNEVNYDTDITWNEPVHTITDPPIISTVAKIIAGTGVFMAVAVVLGIAFGGVRVVTKALFPGKVFDRPDQIEILQLRLSDKRVDPRDSS